MSLTKNRLKLVFDQFIIRIKKLETNVNLVFVGTKWVEIKLCGIKFNRHFKHKYERN